MRTVVALSFALALAAGCSANYPDGRFGCDAQHACPPGLTCYSGTCYRAAPDVGTGDGGGGDAGPVDAAMVGDTGTCTNCITVTLTNAFPATPTGTTMATLGGTMVPLPAYGATSGPFTIPLDATGTKLVATMAAGAPTSMVPATAGHSYALVCNGTSLANLGASLYDLDPSFLPPAAAGTVNAVFVDLLSDPTDLILSRNEHTDTRWTGSRTVPSPTLTISPTDTVEVVRADASDQTTMAGFSAQDFPAVGAFYVFLAGNPDTHLAAPDGIRMIPAVVGDSAHASHELFELFNDTDSVLSVCHGTTSLIDFVNTGSLAGDLIPGFDASGPLTVDVVLESDGCTGASANRHSVTFGAGAGRRLIAAGGDTTSVSTWNVYGLLEPDVAAAGAAQQVTFLDATMVKAAFGATTSTGMSFAAVSANAGMAVVASWSTVPARVDVTFMGGPAPVSFAPWMPTSAVGWGVLTSGTGGVFGMIEIDAPYGHGWINDGYNSSAITACFPYCAALMANCTGANAMYSDVASCVVACNVFAWAPGTMGDATGDTLACRATHAANAATAPGTECAAAGPLGGGVCAPSRCEAYCAEVLTTCVGDEPFPSAATCTAACTTWLDHDSANTPSATVANDLACRLAVLEQCTNDSSLCPDLGATSTSCH